MAAHDRGSFCFSNPKMPFKFSLFLAPLSLYDSIKRSVLVAY